MESVLIYICNGRVFYHYFSGYHQHRTAMSSDFLFESSESSSTDKLIRQLALGSEDLTRSLKLFTKERHSTIQAQKLALVEYDEEMKQIEEMYGLGR